MSENIYYSPGHYGLQIVVEHENDPHPYGFDKYVVWQHMETGKLYFAHDSGCSCPSPFEQYKGIEELEEIEGHKDLRVSLSRMPYSDARDFIEDMKQAVKNFKKKAQGNE